MTATPPSGTGNGCWRSIAATLWPERKLPMTDLQIRNYESSDAEDLNRVAVAAYGQFRDQFQNWPAMLAWLSNASALSATGEVIVAEAQDRFAGAVSYFGPHS